MHSRRDLVLGSAAAAGALAAGEGAFAAVGPTLTGPITGGTRGGAFARYLGDISDQGYVEEEYFIAGEARRYRAAGPLMEHGRWDVRPADSAPFRTRMIVRRPRFASKFNGTVICEWVNVTGGFEIAMGDPQGIYRAGFGYALISAQPAGVQGFPGESRALAHWDPERYGRLSVPGDAASYDIFTQCARTLGPGRGRKGVDPMGGLKVRHLVAVGGSQSAARLTSYANAIQPLENLFSAIIPVVGSGYGTDFEDFLFDRSVSLRENQDRRRAQVIPTRIRADLKTPVVFLNSESEVMRYLPRRQSDTETFRHWEVAGSVHGPGPALRRYAEITRRDGLERPVNDRVPGEVDWAPCLDAVYDHVQRWINGGAPAPEQPPVLVTGLTPQVQRDVHGNARGGVRLPELEVPVATYDPQTPLGAGTTIPFPPEKLKALYSTGADYAAKVGEAAKAAAEDGAILPERRAQYARDAAEVAERLNAL